MADEKFTEKLGSETVTFMKSSLNSAMDNVSTLQTQFEKLLNTIIDQTQSSGAEGKKVVGEWMNMQKKGLDEYKKIVSQNITKMEDIFKVK